MTMSTTRAPKRRRLAASALEPIVMLGPGLAYLIVFVAVPTALVLGYAFAQPGGLLGGVTWSFSLDNFARLFEPTYLKVLATSIWVAFGATVIALAIGYPTAYAMTLLSDRWRLIALVAVLVPFWTNFLIRMYAWLVLLNTQGPVNDALIGLGLIDDPIQLLYSKVTVMLGLSYSYLPLMIVPIYAALLKVDRELLEASANLGALPPRTFASVTGPLSLPGVISGSIFVFVPSLGNFVVPELLGGGKFQMVGNVIRTQFLSTRDWPFGAALAMVVVAMLLLLFAVQSWVTRRVGGESP